MEVYDEEAISRTVGSLDRNARTAFAAACAERLWPLVERYASVVALRERDLVTLRGNLDVAWRAAAGFGSSEVLITAADRAENLVPSEDDDWVVETGYAQNAMAAIVYANRAWLSNGSQNAVWAARQVYDAADYAAQQSVAGAVWVFSPTVESQLAHAPVVQAAIRGIREDLAAVAHEPVDVVRRGVTRAAGEFTTRFP